MFEFHQDRRRYFEIQIENARRFVLPFVESVMPLRPGMRVLEVGCGEGGVLKAFMDRGCEGVGVEFDEPRLANGRQWMPEEIASGQLVFVSKDIYKVTPEELGGLFDLIVFKDVIEHIHDQRKMIGWMKSFLAPGGLIFFGFPPWQMPFGGHQQIVQSKRIGQLPWIHLLPRPLYAGIIRKGRGSVEELMEIRDTQISIEQFERYAKETGYSIAAKKHYLFNPIYEWKFGVKAREQFGFIRHIPWLRNFVTTCVYYLIRPAGNA